MDAGAGFGGGSGSGVGGMGPGLYSARRPEAQVCGIVSREAVYREYLGTQLSRLRYTLSKCTGYYVWMPSVQVTSPQPHAVDQQQLMCSCTPMQVWSLPLQIVAALYLLYLQVGVASVAGLMFGMDVLLDRKTQLVFRAYKCAS